MNLRLHVHHAYTGGWCADIDDDHDRRHSSRCRAEAMRV
jgi:hypothetical protein